MMKILMSLTTKMMFRSLTIMIMLMMMTTVSQPTFQEENKARVQLFEEGLRPNGQLPPINVADYSNDKGLSTYYVSQFRGFSDPPSPPLWARVEKYLKSI